MTPILHSPECFASYMGAWAMHLQPLLAGARLFSAGQLESRQGDDDEDDGSYEVTDGGLAIVPLHGTLMKARSKFGGTSTVTARRKIRAAAADTNVKGIMLHISSPGGTVAGTADLSDDVRKARTAKPVFAHSDDTIASAAYWIGAQANRLTANRTADVGSIGVIAVVEDSSQKSAMEGVKVHVVTNSGAETFKGAFADGTPVTDAQLAYLKEMVDVTAQQFVHDISAEGGGRPVLTKDAVSKLADGRVYRANRAAELGLIDGVSDFDSAVRTAMELLADADMATRRRRVNARLKLAEKS